MERENITTVAKIISHRLNMSFCFLVFSLFSFFVVVDACLDTQDSIGKKDVVKLAVLFKNDRATVDFLKKNKGNRFCT